MKLKILLGPVLLITSLAVLQHSFRVSAAIMLLALFFSYMRFLLTSKRTLLRWLFVTFLILAFLPVDISFENYPGPPHFVPLIMGLPTDLAVREYERGEVMLGGCIMRGNEPQWVLVW